MGNDLARPYDGIDRRDRGVAFPRARRFLGNILSNQYIVVNSGLSEIVREEEPSKHLEVQDSKQSRSRYFPDRGRKSKQPNVIS